MVEFGPADEVFNAPKHDYTKRLLEAAPGKDWHPPRLTNEEALEIAASIQRASPKKQALATVTSTSIARPTAITPIRRSLAGLSGISVFDGSNAAKGSVTRCQSSPALNTAR